MSRHWFRVVSIPGGGRWEEVGIEDPENEFKRWLEEREAILKMNKSLNARSTRGGEGGRALAAEAEGAGESPS